LSRDDITANVVQLMYNTLTVAANDDQDVKLFEADGNTLPPHDVLDGFTLMHTSSTTHHQLMHNSR